MTKTNKNQNKKKITQCLTLFRNVMHRPSMSVNYLCSNNFNQWLNIINKSRNFDSMGIYVIIFGDNRTSDSKFITNDFF